MVSYLHYKKCILNLACLSKPQTVSPGTQTLNTILRLNTKLWDPKPKYQKMKPNPFLFLPPQNA